MKPGNGPDDEAGWEYGDVWKEGSPDQAVNGDDIVGGGTFMYYFHRQNEPPLSEPCYIRTTFIAGQDQYADMNVSFNNYWDSERQNLFTSFGYQRRIADYFQPFIAQRP